MTSPCLSCTAPLALRQIYLQVRLTPTTNPQSAISGSGDPHVLMCQLVISHPSLSPARTGVQSGCSPPCRLEPTQNT